MTEKLIELVRCEPCLYDTNHTDYSNKTLKELLWVRIAKELNYKDGSSAKYAWLKLRNCHREAIRRRNKLSRSGSAATVTKSWKFENQMEFLVTYMTNRPTTGNMSTGNHISEDQHLVYPEVFIQENETDNNEILPTQTSPQVRPLNSTGSNSNERSIPFSPFLPHNIAENNSTEDAVGSELQPSIISQTRIPHVLPPAFKKSTIKKHNINTLIANTLQNHENRAKERAEKRRHSDERDELQHFFNAMYGITKKMPALSQHKLKRKIFNIVSDEEEYLLHVGSIPLPSPSTPMPSTLTPMPSTLTPMPFTLTPMPSTLTPMPSTSTSMLSTATPINSPSTPMPSTSTSMLSTATPINSPSTPVPSTATPMPSPEIDWCGYNVYSEENA